VVAVVADTTVDDVAITVAVAHAVDHVVVAVLDSI